MRDKKRIDKIMDKITQAWKRHPDMRLNQLLINLCVIPDGNNWSIEDEEVLKNLEANINKI